MDQIQLITMTIFAGIFAQMLAYELKLPAVVPPLAIGTSLGYLLGTWAIVVNRFFSAVVRIQRERGHTVVTSGPYRSVRHPGYAGSVVANFASPLLLDSLWTLIPVVCLLMIRAELEDRTLREEGEGYQDYAAWVGYRLLP